MTYIRIFKHYVKVPYLLLGLVEMALYFLSIYLGASVRLYGNDPIFAELGPLYPRAILFSVVLILSMMAMGVYQSKAQEGMSGITLRVAVSFLMAAAVLSMLFYIFPGLYMGRGVLAISAIIAFILSIAIRIIFRRIADEQHIKRRIAILGAGKAAQNLYDRIVMKNGAGIEIAGIIPMPNEAVKIDSHLILETDDLHQWAVESKVEEIVVAISDRRQGYDLNSLLDCKLDGIQVVEAITFFEREAGRVELDLLYPSWLVFSDGFNLSAFRSFIIRIFDIISSAALLLVTWPVMAATAFAIIFEDGLGASFLYRQERVGYKGRRFNVYKFRSMREDAEKFGAQWAQENDPRVTKVGHFIRKYRIDELPQILNVFRGDMGFVGPRPERPEFVVQLSEKNRYFSERHRVKPGITGWAQLNYPYGASEYDAFRKLEYDLYYVKNHSLLLDLLILIRTVEVILFGKGAR